VLLVGTGPLAVVARSGVENGLGPAVEVTTTFSTITDMPLSLNAAGATAFYSSLSGPLVTPATDRGLWSTAGGNIGLVARSGVDDLAGPGLGAGVMFVDPFASGANRGVLNNAGDMVFHGTIAGPGVGASNYGFWRATPLGPRPVLRVGDVVDGLGTVTHINSGGETFGWNDSAQLAFPITVAPAAGPSFRDVVRVETDPVTSLTPLARTGIADGPLAPDVAVIGAGHTFGGFMGDTTGTGVLMNAGGEVVFEAAYSGPAGSGNRGIFINAGGVNRIVASTNVADDVLGPGLGADAEFSSFSTMHLNACGQVVVQAAATSPRGVEAGLWAWTGETLRRIAVKGEWFDVDPTEGEDLRQVRGVAVQARGSGGNDSRPRALNDHGVVVFLLQFEDLTWGLFTAALPLEGSAARCVPNVGPSADAGQNRAVRQGSEVTLSGAGSTDPDDGPEPLTLAWTQTAGPEVALTDATAVDPRFTPVAPGSYTFELVVFDGDLSSPPDTTTISVPMLGDLDLDGDVDTDDLAVIESALGSPASSANDLRDLNGDAIVDAQDADLLKSLCTRPQCAVSDPPADTADIGLALSASTLTPNVGDVVTFTLTVTNHGPAPAANVVIRALPADGFESAGIPDALNQGIVLEDEFVDWSVGALASGASATWTRALRVRATGPYAVSFRRSGSVPDDPGNQNDLATVTIVAPTADIGLALSASTLTPNVGDVVTFTLTVTNHGPTPAANVVIRALPASGFEGAGIPDALSKGILLDDEFVDWSVGALASGASATWTRAMRVRATGPYDVSFRRHGSVPDDSSPLNDIANVTIVAPSADVGLELNVSTMSPPANGFVTFTLTVTNHGPTAATGVVVRELDESGYANAASLGTVTQGSLVSFVDDGYSLAWTVGPLASGASATLTRLQRVLPTGTYAKRFVRTDSTPDDPNADNDAASVTLTPLIGFDIEVAATASTLTPEVGDVVTLTITATNHGPNTATLVKVRDFAIGGGLLNTGAPTVSHGTLSANGQIWNVGTLASGAVATLTRTVIVQLQGSHQRSFFLWNRPDDELVIENNTGVIALNPITEYDLAVMASVDTLTPEIGDPVTFTVTVTNNGPASASNVKVRDFVNASGLPYAGPATVSQGTVANQLWTVGSLASGATATFTRTATAQAAGGQTRLFILWQSGPDEADATNNSAVVTVTPISEVHLDLDVEVSTLTPQLDESITYTITITNDGPSTATGVIVRDAKNGDFYAVAPAAVASQGSFGDQDWTVGTLAAGASATLTRTVRLQPTGEYHKTIFVKESSPFDSDFASFTVTPITDVDLGVTMSVTNLTPNFGDTITFTTTVTNHGPATANGVKLTFSKPTGYSGGASVSQGNGDIQNWSVGTLLSGASATWTRTVTVQPTGNYDMHAFLVASTPSDNGTAFPNHAALTPTPLSDADLGITMSVSNLTPNILDTITFTTTVTNHGPATATGVTLEFNKYNAYPNGSVSVSQGNATAHEWSVGTLLSGASATLTRTVTVPASGDYAMQAWLEESTPPDNSNLHSNFASVTPTPLTDVDLEITLSVTNLTPNFGDSITFTTTVTNHGPATAHGVHLRFFYSKDALAGGDPSFSQGTGDTQNWSVGTLPSGASATWTRTVTVLAGGNSYLMSALLWDSFPDDNGAEYPNEASQFVMPLSVADIEVAAVASTLAPNAGDTITFTVTVTNHGPATATGVQVKDPALSGFVDDPLAAAIASHGTYSAATRKWTVGTLASGASATLTRRVRVQPSGRYDKSFFLLQSFPEDPNGLNNEVTLTVVPQ
jgi:uncharacterized repeat protein (TIGR01451 family)